jgi:hypothetical protein
MSSNESARQHKPQSAEARLAALLLGDLPAADALKLQAEVAQDAQLQKARGNVEGLLGIMRADPQADVSPGALKSLFDKSRDMMAEPEVAQQADLIRISELIRVYLPRVAAVAVVVFTFGMLVTKLPEGPVPTVGTVVDEDGKQFIRAGELVEARMGSPRRVTFNTGEVLLDGGTALRVSGGTGFTTPSISLERGRVAIDARSRDFSVSVAGRNVHVGKGGLATIELDVPYAHIDRAGAVVEIRRTTVKEVAELAKRTWGVDLYAGGLPQMIQEQRVSFYGVGLDSADFVQSFVAAASRFGVRLGNDGQSLEYRQASGSFDMESEQVLRIATVRGDARVQDSAGELALSELSQNVVEFRTGTEAAPRNLEPERLGQMLVWAGGLGNESVATHLPGVNTSDEQLPQGSVIYTDKLVLHGEEDRVYVLNGPEFNFPLPGGRMGRLVGLMSSGAEFEVEGETAREFVPFRRLSEGK